MSDPQLQKILEQLADHEKRIRVLEGGDISSDAKKNPDNKNKKHKSKGEDLYAPIYKLVQDNFFKEAKIDVDVVSELQRRLLTRKKPLRASVVNVLRKLVRDGVLERTEIVRNEKKLVAYIKT